MNKKDHVLDVILRILNTEMKYGETDKTYKDEISYQIKAEEEIESNADYIEPLKEIIEERSSNKKQDKDIRSMAYSWLEKIALNTNHCEIFEFFEKQLAKETDKYILELSLLMYLLRNEYVVQLEYVLPLVYRKEWQVKHDAISLLGRLPKSEVEDILLELLEEATNTYEIEKTLGALRRVHSKKVLAMIDRFLQHEKGDVRSSAIATLRVDGGKEYMPVFLKALKDRSGVVKLNALSAVIQYGEEEVIDPLIERLKTMVKTKRKLTPYKASDSEVVSILEFLLRYRDEEKVQEIFKWLKENKWENLIDVEQEWYVENVEGQKEVKGKVVSMFDWFRKKK